MQTKSGEKVPAEKNAMADRGPEKTVPVADSPTADEIEQFQSREKRVRNYLHHAKKVVAGNFASILQTLAEKSAQGSLSHMKYLFEIGGVKETIQRRRHGKSEPSLADLLRAEVRKQRTSDDPAAKEIASANDGVGAAAETEERGGDCGAKAQ